MCITLCVIHLLPADRRHQTANFWGRGGQENKYRVCPQWNTWIQLAENAENVRLPARPTWSNVQWSPNNKYRISTAHFGPFGDKPSSVTHNVVLTWRFLKVRMCKVGTSCGGLVSLYSSSSSHTGIQWFMYYPSSSATYRPCLSPFILPLEFYLKCEVSCNNTGCQKI